VVHNINRILKIETQLASARANQPNVYSRFLRSVQVGSQSKLYSTYMVERNFVFGSKLVEGAVDYLIVEISLTLQHHFYCTIKNYNAVIGNI